MLDVCLFVRVSKLVQVDSSSDGLLQALKSVLSTDVSVQPKDCLSRKNHMDLPACCSVVPATYPQILRMDDKNDEASYSRIGFV